MDNLIGSVGPYFLPFKAGGPMAPAPDTAVRITTGGVLRTFRQLQVARAPAPLEAVAQCLLIPPPLTRQC